MSTLILAYISPETTLPIASAIAASVGFALAVGRTAWRFLKRTKNAVVGEQVKRV